MNPLDTNLQKRLERLEAGDSLAECQADLTPDQAELLALAWALRQVHLPEQAPDVVAERREMLLQRAQERIDMNEQTESSSDGRKRSWPSWLLPVGLGAAALGTIVVIGVALMAVAGLFMFNTGTAEKNAAGDNEFVEMPPNQIAFGQSEWELRGIAGIEVPEPDRLVLARVRGLVEIRNSAGEWTKAQNGQILTAGQHIRTGALSSATLAFYDGSYAVLEANTEMFVDELAARKDGPRVINLMQIAGRSHHEVAHSEAEGSSYAVNTPNGTGEAKGTSFTVIVSSIFVRFNTSDGTVAVTNLDTTVLVVAGQSTTVYPDEEPEDPVFQIVGEGEVGLIGDTWGISGRSFLTNSTTQIIGNPQIGDWVYVEARVLSDGTRFADRIELLRRAPENSFEFTGVVDNLSDDMWMVDGQEVAVDENTDIQEGIEEGDTVVVSGVVLDDDTQLAESIRLYGDEALHRFEFLGVVESQEDEWLISGQVIATDDETEIIGEIEEGNVVKVEGWILEDGTWLAEEIKLAEIDLTFEFTGEVEDIDPWLVAGIEVDTDEWTEISEDIEEGNQVKVEGTILEDGTWLAEEIKLIPEETSDDKDAAFRFEVTGEVESIDLWIVAGTEFTVDEDTVIDENIEVGSRVHVSGVVLEDSEEENTLLAETIVLLDEDELVGCLTYVSVVSSVEEDGLTLYSGQFIPLGDDIEVEGELVEGAVILMVTCTDEDNTITIMVIVVVAVLDEVPEGPFSDSGGSELGNVVCHIPPGNPERQHTIIVGASAVSAHLGHGDTLGPCQ